MPIDDADHGQASVANEVHAVDRSAFPRVVRLQDLASRRMSNPKAHAALYRWTGGRVGARLPMVTPPMALVTTTGRRSGAPRVTPLVCFRDGDRLAVAATNNGSGVTPGWLHNMRNDPEVRIRLGTDESAGVATEVNGEERDRLWNRMVREHPLFGLYEQRSPTDIPVVVIRPERELGVRRDDADSTTRRLRTAIVVSGLGHVVHNVSEFDAVRASAQSAFPLAVTAAFWVAARRPTRAYLSALIAWALVVVVIGGGSVLPLPIWPFEPAQTMGHYVVHALYALAQLPVLVVACRALVSTRRPPVDLSGRV